MGATRVWAIGPLSGAERAVRKANGTHMDDIDLALLRLVLEEPRAGMREYARILGVARGTVQSRLSRLERSGVIASHSPRIDPARLGFPVLAQAHLHLAQGRLEQAVTSLAGIAEVVEAHSIAGEGDLVCRIVARDNAHLEDVIQQLLRLPGVVRTKTEVMLREHVPYRVLPLLAQRGRTGPGATGR
ncbi:AsnC family transcriptional regulator [Microtetraspora sp. NBRC 13810]|uniref:Lrp/AsnC family transcriptional regulator n=1 Tax=Microtetraspora sp. NBRC 13810 TaxID=3030990 RepID=UPI0024A3E309|nr:Lrp/AsnC family transcriptional regulator [Microtetraspora sp. NBRC 13810]GLW06933.1 AsnC family transcriptional regulator [Microtetraspora sp. NBRC 13810]